MRKTAYYLPKSDEERAPWLNNFAAKLPKYATKYNITPEEVMDMQMSAPYYDVFVKYRVQSGAFQYSLTDHRDIMSEGVSNGTTLEPLQPPMLTLPPAPQPGIFKRVRALVSRIKSHVHYSEADGSDLGIVGAESSSTDYNNLKPVFPIRLVGGGHPELGWVRQGMTAVEIQKRVGDEPWRSLAIDTVPTYIDKEPLPPSGKSEVWEYRMIYHFKDERVGQWSDVVSVTVTG
jgi:hypothetical protein